MSALDPPPPPPPPQPTMPEKRSSQVLREVYATPLFTLLLLNREKL